jgi:hypothetical protein
MPRGEGAFGIAKAVPMILLYGSAAAFCVIWFPANLGVFLNHRRVQPNGSADEAVPLVFFSGIVFVVCIATVGMMWHRAHSPQSYAPPAPQRPIELKDVKEVIDSFCAKERKGEKLTPADGIFATMEQLVWLSPPDVINYMGDNLDDNSGFLWVIAACPNCPSNLFTRFLSVPSTHESLARNPATSPQVLESLSHSTNWQVRARVAANANTPEATLERLAGDPERGVRESVERNLRPRIRQK